MKRIAVFLLIFNLALAVMAGGGAQGKTAADGKPTVTLWTTGSQNLSDLFSLLISTYNARPDAKATVRLQFVMSGSGDVLLQDRIAAAYKTKSTNDHFDIVAENSTSIPNWIGLAGSPDLLLPIDFSKIPNYKNVLIKSAFDNTKVVPYRGTTVVFAYDSARVPNPPKTWAELEQWIKDHPGRFAYNPPASGGAGGAFVYTSVYRNLPRESWISTDEKWAAQWEPGFAWLKSLHPYMYKSGGSVVYPNKNQGPLDLLINKEVDIIPAWADQALTNLDAGILPATVKIYQLDQALSGTDVVFTLPSLGANQDAACDFINFVLSPEGQKICLETIFAVPVIDPSLISSAKAAAVSGLDVSGFSIISLGTLGTRLNDKWDTDIATLP
jgi:putative spermidine/putrescine transport system substrate-binding protein